MDRRKTILIAVLVNAGLLVLLFIAFLYQEEEVPVRQGLVQQQMEESRPLFNDAALAVSEPVVSAPMIQQVAVEHLLPPIAAVEEPVATQSPAPSPLAAVAAAVEIQVKKGDTLEKIAKAHHTTVDEIIQFNQLPSSFLRVGQVLKLPPERAVSTPKMVAAEKKAVGHEYYTVKVGDNPWTIAMKHHMKVEELLKLNNLNEEKARRLKVGDKLRIQ